MTIKEQNEIKKNYLKGYKRVCNRIKTLKLQEQELRETKESAKAQEYSDMPSSNKHSDLSDYIIKLERLEENVRKKMKEKQREKLDIESRITDIQNDIESDILYKRYIQFMEWSDIAKDIGYSERQVYRYHGKALHDLEYNFKNKNKDVS